MSQVCHHIDGLIRIAHRIWEVGSHIVDIDKPSTINLDNFETMGSVF